MIKTSKVPYFALVQTVWQYAGAWRSHVLTVYIMATSANILLMFQPWVLGQTINILQEGGEGLFEKTAYWLGIYFLLTVGFWSLHGPSRVIERRAAFRVRGHYVDHLYKALTELPLKWHKDHHSGSTINRLRKASDGLFRFAGTQFIYIEAITRFLGPIVAISLINIYMGVAIFAGALLVFFVMALFDRVLVRLFAEENELEHKFFSALSDYLGNVTSVITLRLEQMTRSEVGRRFVHIFAPYKKGVTINEVKWFVLSLFMAGYEAAMLLVYIYYHTVTEAALMLGTLVAIYQYLRHLNQSFIFFAMMYQEMLRQHTDVQAVRPMLADHEAMGVKATSATNLEEWQQADVADIHFTYEDKKHQKHELQNVHIHLEKGRRIALVGESGAGKSTLMALLRGLYEPKDVSLNIDGQTYKNLQVIGNMSTLIPQDPEIFENTIAFNIAAGLDHTDDDLMEAARIACFADVLKKLPNGLQTDVRERGVNLSGGQKQRLALARGIFAARFSDIILLDEPTSSVDGVNEQKIYANLVAAFPDKCIISSIHRLHLLKHFDWIYVMANGEVVEEGTLDGLIAKGGSFAAMWHAQQEKKEKKGK